jgi:prepilin-type processing-associated H-X9-DG protein
VRCSGNGPFRDKYYTNVAWWQMFGAAHPESMNALLADGSVRPFRYAIANPIFQILCRKSDGSPLSAAGLQ